jgi:uncharacterized membrane protein SirB2
MAYLLLKYLHTVAAIATISGFTLRGYWMLTESDRLQQLLAKFAGLFIYILLGTIALRRGSTMQTRSIAFVGAIAVFAYIAGVAMVKSSLSWLKYFSA